MKALVLRSLFPSLVSYLRMRREFGDYAANALLEDYGIR